MQSEKPPAEPSGPRPLIIGIAGGSGSGKTYLARQIVAALGDENAATLSMDQYFKTEASDAEAAKNVNFDHPSHLDFRGLIQNVRQLRSGKAVFAPKYDFVTMRQSAASVLVEPRAVIVVEGLFVLAEPVVSLCDLTCFLDVATDERLMGRILRDIKERQADIEGVIDRYQRFVRPSYRIFVEPTMQNADAVIDFSFRRTMFTQLLIGLLRSYVADRPDQKTFVFSLKAESSILETRPRDGFMSMTTDILKLAKAYPEQGLQPESTPALFSPVADSLGHSRTRADYST
jgi:uridine kinase